MKRTPIVAALLCAPLSLLGCGEAAPDAATPGTLRLPLRACVVNFEATVRSGPSAGTALVGYAVFQTDGSGALVDSHMRTVDGRTLPVTGRATGRDVTLRFDLGDGRAVQGTGTLGASIRDCQGEMRGPLTGPMPGDTGDWLGGDGDVVFVPEGEAELALGDGEAVTALRGGLTTLPDAGFVLGDASIGLGDAAAPPPPPPPPAGGAGQTVMTAGGVLYLSNPSQHVIYRALSSFGPLTVFAGAVNQPGNVNGTRAAARFNSPTGIAFDAARSRLLVADTGNQQVRAISTSSNAVTTLVARPAVSAASVAAGFAPITSFGTRGVGVTGTGAVVVSDASNHCVWSLSAAGQTTLLAGRPQMPGTNDGAGTAARFTAPGTVVGGSSNIAIVNEGCRVRLVEVPTRTVSSIGSAGCGS